MRKMQAVKGEGCVMAYVVRMGEWLVVFQHVQVKNWAWRVQHVFNTHLKSELRGKAFVSDLTVKGVALLYESQHRLA